MKLGGFALLLLAAVWISVQLVVGRQKHAEALDALCALLDQLASELQNGQRTMTEVLDALRSNHRGQAGAFLDVLCTSMKDLGGKSFSELWQAAVCEQSALSEDEKRELILLGMILGRYDTHTQMCAISHCVQTLRGEWRHLKGSMPQYRRLAFGLSLAAAGLLGILMI